MNKRASRPFGRRLDLNLRNMRLGFWAWLIQRVTGVVLVLYVVAHVVAISQANLEVIGPFFTLLDGLRNPFWAVDTNFIAVDLLMLGIIAFHGMNGIRIVVFDFGVAVGLRSHKVLFWILVTAGVIVCGLVIFYGLPLLRGVQP